ncbi:hypothetical protein TELCIR_21127 [Teladorsagia circumcincta]|uniref:Peptidase M12A domain-containing protein n=1 Tax=Teladorsagia circumcincta TaxID=45464 RepID=A0A2G9THL7_TELCI|nr:hypothetical protein TELCIR_21127 [Teladorsagia circumcincta]
MHYGATSFINKKAEEAGGFTMVPKDFNYLETLGSRVIGFYDLLMMNIYYNCTDVCKDAPTRCHNGGFAHPRDCSKCICPSGYGGRFCSSKSVGTVLTSNSSTVPVITYKHESFIGFEEQVDEFEYEYEGEDEEDEDEDENQTSEELPTGVKLRYRSI